MANQKTIDLKDTRSGEYILKMIESSDGQNFPAELKDFLKDLQQAPSSQTKDIPIPEFRLREEQANHSTRSGAGVRIENKKSFSMLTSDARVKANIKIYRIK
ncbi:hypothetical protein [Enterococcus mundtii]|uniref:hypothetical protein n=1 Tax=Enterococcus mundtii TaxID=53346 RepID=UPI0035C6EB24